MFGVRLRVFALVCIALTYVAQAQEGASAKLFDDQVAGSIYEQSREDTTIPIATYDREDRDNSTLAVTVPLENAATPMRCMTAWSFLAGRIIRSPEEMRELHPDFTEATASAHWQHWLKQDLDAHQGGISSDFHQRRLAAERAFSLALAEQEEAYAFRTLGGCYVRPIERALGDPTLLLRNFMVDHQGLPDSYAVPVLQRQLRAFPITEAVESASEENCDRESVDLMEQVRKVVVTRCFEQGGILNSTPKLTAEDIGGLCRATGTVQCENIP
ncbi:MAG: hypothetical protein AAGA72_11635 [Pseudomonadota bacterium]